MKKVYEEPLCEDVLLLSESVMLDSGEEESEEELVDNEQRDNEVNIFTLLGK